MTFTRTKRQESSPIEQTHLSVDDGLPGAVIEIGESGKTFSWL